MRQRTLIVGLGNPGISYKNTRHNFGFIVLDKIAKDLEVKFNNVPKFQAKIIEHENFMLAKPQIFMNLSGESASKIASFYKIETSNIVVIHDDFDLPLGSIRMRQDGSAGGHKGVASIISALGEGFYRIRLGIGRDDRKTEMEKFVLQKFRKEEKMLVNKVALEVSRIIINLLRGMPIEPKTINIKIEKGP